MIDTVMSPRFQRRRTSAYVGSYAAYVAFLHAVPGPWRHWKRKSGRAIDPWTGSHILWGAYARIMGIPLVELTALAAANEVGEYAIRRTRPDLLWGSPESTMNVFVDMVATGLGWLLAAMLMRGRRVRRGHSSRLRLTDSMR